MSIESESPEHIAYLRNKLIKQQSSYVASVETQRAMAGKTFTGIVGPTGIGKTTITSRVLELDSDIKPIDTITTRNRKPNGEDPEGYQTADEGITFQSISDAVDNGEFVNYFVNPNGHVYATRPEGFTARHNIGPFVSDNIDQMLNAGVDANFVYIIAPGEIWRSFIQKSRLEYKDLRARAEEAIDSITFAQRNITDLKFIENTGGNIDDMANNFIDIAVMNRTNPILLPGRIEQDLAEMLAVAKDLAVHS